MPRHSVRVTGLVITENEFPANGARYDLFPTRAYATAHDAHTLVLTFYDVKPGTVPPTRPPSTASCARWGRWAPMT